jgi:cytochrome c peroxidase
LLVFSAEERQAILAFGPWPPPPTTDSANRWQGQPAAVALGRALFFDRSLSASGGLACASCHRPASAFSEPLAASRNARNTPSLLDVGQQRWFGWDGAHDSLWAASLAPLTASHELAATPAQAAARLSAGDALGQAYRRVFGPPVADTTLLVNLAKALAAYQATLVSPRTPFDDFRDALARGDLRQAAAYPLAAQRGLRLFIGEARCSTCHAGPRFSNGEFADIGRPFFKPGGGVDPGRWGGLSALLANPNNRLGAHNDTRGGPAADPRAVLTRQVLQAPRHYGEFRVPGLRQLVHTAPYMHDGGLPTLAAVVQHYDQLNEERLHADGERLLRPLKLSAAERQDLLAFLDSLSTPQTVR